MSFKSLITLALVSALVGCGESGDRLVAEQDVVLVEVDGKPVTLEMLEYLMEVRDVGEDDTEGMRGLLDELIRLHAVAAEAEREGISSRPRVRAERRIKDIEVQYVRYLEDFQRDNPIAEADIREVYQRQVERAGDTRYRLETIEFDERAAAEAQLDTLLAGETGFDQAVQAAAAEGRNARRTDWVDASQVPAEFAAALDGTEAGGIVPRLLEQQGLLMVVRVRETDAMVPPALDEVRDGIRRQLARERSAARIEAIYEAAEITPVLPLNEDQGAPEAG